MYYALLDDCESLPPLPTLLAIPTPEQPYPLTRRWAPDGHTGLTDDQGRVWWAFTATVPRECSWCHATITRGYEAWGVGAVCGWHIQLRHEREGDHDPRNADGDPLPDPAGNPGDRAVRDVPQPSLVSGPPCPECGAPLAGGQCPYWRWHHTYSLPQNTPDLNTSGEGPC